MLNLRATAIEFVLFLHTHTTRLYSKSPANVWSNQSISEWEIRERAKRGEKKRDEMWWNKSKSTITERRSTAVHIFMQTQASTQHRLHRWGIIHIYDYYYCYCCVVCVCVFSLSFIPFAGMNLSYDAKHLMDFHFNYFHSFDFRRLYIYSHFVHIVVADDRIQNTRKWWLRSETMKQTRPNMMEEVEKRQKQDTQFNHSIESKYTQYR